MRALVHFLLLGILASPLFAQDPKPDEVALQAIQNIASTPMPNIDATLSTTAQEQQMRDYATSIGLQILLGTEKFDKDFPESTLADDADYLKAQAAFHLDRVTEGKSADADRAVQALSNRKKLGKDAASMLVRIQFGRNEKGLDDSSTAADAAKAIDQSVSEFAKKYPDAEETDFLRLIAARTLSEHEQYQGAREIAQRLKSSKTEGIQERAESLLSQLEMIGKSPEIRFTAIDGKEIDIAKLKGKVVLVDFWATWCPPCVASVPELKEVYGKYHDKGFEIVGISLDDERSELDAFIKKNQILWPQYYDGKKWENKFATKFEIHSIPRAWLIDRDGKIVSVEVVGRLDKKVAGLLKDKSESAK